MTDDLAALPAPICHDAWLSENLRRQVHDYLLLPGWQFGWKSAPMTDRYAFWHKHFAGALAPPDDTASSDAAPEHDCAAELAAREPLLHRLWLMLAESVLPGQRLVRCYANGHAFGGEGTLHTDTASRTGRTALYYPHAAWSPNWGGETVFFAPDRSDILAAVYPRPNRLVTFAGALPHVARGVSRLCPLLRVTLMFKTEQITEAEAASPHAV